MGFRGFGSFYRSKDSGVSIVLVNEPLGLFCGQSTQEWRNLERARERERPVIADCLGVVLGNQGSLKDTCCPVETWLFPPKIKGHHHLQGNVQVYDIRIPGNKAPLSETAGSGAPLNPSGQRGQLLVVS